LDKQKEKKEKSNTTSLGPVFTNHFTSLIFIPVREDTNRGSRKERRKDIAHQHKKTPTVTSGLFII
jgi:hypothetical protein